VFVGQEGLNQGYSAMSPESSRDNYAWMLELSAEGWAWEFLRRNPSYRSHYLACRKVDNFVASRAAHRWGLLNFADPDEDARSAIVFWNPEKNRSVLPLVTAGEGCNGLVGLKCRVSILELSWSAQRHVLYSCCGRFLQLAISGEGDLNRVRYMMDALPERSSDPKLVSLRRLADLTQHKDLRPALYSRQKRGPRLSHIAEVLDYCASNPAHRSIAHAVFGKDRAEEEWENIRDHVRRALAAGRKLMQGGYLEFLC
jgi:hypothetical protein